MTEKEIRAQYDAIGPAPNMPYAQFRKEIKLILDPKAAKRDLGMMAGKKRQERVYKMGIDKAIEN